MVVLKHLKNIIKDAASSAFHVLLGLGARTSTDKAGPGQPREAAPGGASPGTSLCAILPKSGATYVNTSSEQFEGPWLRAEIKAKRLAPH